MLMYTYMIPVFVAAQITGTCYQNCPTLTISGGCKPAKASGCNTESMCCSPQCISKPGKPSLFLPTGGDLIVCNSAAPSNARSPAPTAPLPAPSTKIAPKGLNAATIAGIIVAVLVLLFLGFVLFLAQRRRAKDNDDQASTDNYVQMTDRKFQRRGPSDAQLRELSLQVFLNAFYLCVLSVNVTRIMSNLMLMRSDA